MQTWIETEMDGLDLGDTRRDQRGCFLLDRLSQNPRGSLPATFSGWAETQAAYRFFDNSSTDPDKILLPHRQATIDRVCQHDVVLIPQDTTELNFARSVEGGFGKLNYDERLGLLEHTSLAITPDGLCLGVTLSKVWARPLVNPHEGQRHWEIAIKDKESYRWLEGYRDASQVACKAPGTLVVSIADRECDIYECLRETPEPQQGESAEWIVRAAQDRSLEPNEADTNAEEKLREAAAAFPLMARHKVHIRARKGQSARDAHVVVRAGRVTLKAPFRKGQKLDNVSVNVVWVHEPNPPQGVAAVDWLLLTSLPIDSVEAVDRVVKWYAARWWIEIYFRTYKQGCRVERLQLQTAERVENALALYKIVAWRLQYVTLLGRECPEVSCESVFSESEWRGTWSVATGTVAPLEAPTLGDFLNQVACLGGYLGRKHDGPPGTEVMWRGLRRVFDFSLAWTTFNELSASSGRPHSTCV